MIANRDARVLVVNAHVALRDGRAGIEESPAFATLEAAETDHFLRLLRQNAKAVPLLLHNHAALEDRLSESSEFRTLRIRALLRAASRYVADALRRERRWIAHPVEASNGERFWVVPESKGVFRLEISKRLPKSDDEIAPTLHSLHKGLELIPERIGDWSIAKTTHPLDPAADNLLRERAQTGALRIGVSPMTSDAALSIRPLTGYPLDSPRFIVENIGDHSTQLEMLRRVLRECFDQGISILVLPELRMPPEFTMEVAEFLRSQKWTDLRAGKGILAVAAGSWHFPNDHGQGWHNRMYILDHRGKRILHHDKLAPYTSPQHGLEGIVPGATLQFLETSIGRIAGAICVGFFHKPIEQLLIASRAEIFLVPAMSPRTGDLVARAGELVRSQRASTFVAACATVGATPEGASFYRTPLTREAVVMESGDLLTFHFQFTEDA